MGVVAQYTSHNTKGGRLTAYLLVWDEAKPSERHLVSVDATDLASLDEIETCALKKFRLANSVHPLMDYVAAACRDGLQVDITATAAKGDKSPAPPALPRKSEF